MRWVKALVDRSIAEHFGWPDLEFAWKQDRDIDPLTQAQINQIYLAAGVLSPGEVRAEIGKGDAKRQAGGVALGKDWQTQGRQGEGAQNPGWFGNGTSGSTAVVPVSHAATYGAAGAVVGGAVAAVGSVVLDGLSGGVNAPLTPAEVAAGAAIGGVVGHEVGRLMDQWSNQSSEPEQSAPKESGERTEWGDGVIDSPPGENPSFQGKPGSTVRGVSKSRTYGEDGYPKIDRETPHQNEAGIGGGDHAHDWGRSTPGKAPRDTDRQLPRLPRAGDPPYPHQKTK